MSFEAHAADLGSAGFSAAGANDGSAQTGRLGYTMFGASVLAYVGSNRKNVGRRGLSGYGRLGLVSVDNQQIGNSLDRCPQSHIYHIVNGAGCEAFAQRIEVVNFAWDSADLDDNAQRALDYVALRMRNNPGASLGLAAHTDSSVPAAYNQSLSLRRAVAVADYLHARGVSKSALAISLEADSAPTANNGHATGRGENRRVELFANELPAHNPWQWHRAK